MGLMGRGQPVAVRASAESDLYAPVKRWLETQGYTVRGEVRDCDVVAMREGERWPVVVELKRRFNLSLFLQAVDRLKVTPYVYVAAERSDRKNAFSLADLRRLCGLLGIGLLTVRLYKRKAALVELHIEPAGERGGGGSAFAEAERGGGTEVAVARKGAGSAEALAGPGLLAAESSPLAERSLAERSLAAEPSSPGYREEPNDGLPRSTAPLASLPHGGIPYGDGPLHGSVTPKSPGRRTARMLKEFNGRSGDYNTGGSTGRKVVTAYRERALRCAEALQANGPLAPRQVRDLVASDTAASILQQNVYGWFRRITRGLYELTPVGEEALAHYAEVLAGSKR